MEVLPLILPFGPHRLPRPPRAWPGRLRCGKQFRSATRTSLARRSISLVALIAYVITSAGIPIPLVWARPAVASSSTPAFPCQGHACGCSASSCWTSCCCHTPAQRLAWAKAHRIEPPRELIVQIKAQAPAGCCTQISVAQSGGSSSGCCSRAEQSSEPNKAEGGSTSQAPGFVLGILARKCQGLADAWVTSGAVLPPPSKLVWQPSAGAGQWLAVASDWPNACELLPPVPPPRV